MDTNVKSRAKRGTQRGETLVKGKPSRSGPARFAFALLRLHVAASNRW